MTDKTQYKGFHGDVVSRLCREIGESGKDVIIVHGAGSFGHVLAHDNRLAEGIPGGGSPQALAEVSRDVRELNIMVTERLLEAGIPCISIPPSSCFRMSDGRLYHTDLTVMRSYMDLGLVPVTFGDIALDDKRGFGICSGDQLMEVLAEEFSPERVVFVSDVDGLFDRDPKACADARLIREFDATTLEGIPRESSVKDVTGGLHGKMESMLRMCGKSRDCVLVNGSVEGRLLSLLKGRDVDCTVARNG